MTNAPAVMWALCVEGDQGKLQQIPKPTLQPGFALVRVLRAGVCNTDLEILQGYMGFKGVLGHEFVGLVEEVAASAAGDQYSDWIGQRVCGDINVGCANCRVCQGCFDPICSKMGRNHCPTRTVLGILNRDGTMAEYLSLPVTNLHVVPDDIPDAVAVFAEPLAAACRIVEQKLIRPKDRIAILGDGKLGLMIAEVLGRHQKSTESPAPVLFGKHQSKLDLVKTSGVDGRMVAECQDASQFTGVAVAHAGQYDLVVDATGSPAGLTLAAGLCRPMGTLVLKSTCAAGEKFNAAPFVIDELSVVGSRCGPIEKALELLALTGDDSLQVEKYITKTFPLSQAEEAIRCAAEKSTMKVQIICSER